MASDYYSRELRQRAIELAVMVTRDSTTDIKIVLSAAKEIEKYIMDGDEEKAKLDLLEE
jgi:hypothetical protein